MNRAIMVIVAALVVSAISVMASETREKQRTLVTSYYRYLMAGELDGYCAELSAKATNEQKEEIRTSLSKKKNAIFLKLKDDLSAELGDNAQAEFASFISGYTSAAKDGNTEYRQGIARALSISPVPVDYAALRNTVVSATMQKDIEDLSKFLSDIDMWIPLKQRVKTAMALEVWLHREDEPGRVAVPVTAHVTTDGKIRSLRDAETALPEFKADATEEANPMDTFTDQRKSRRQKAMDEAKSGMQQVAQERETAEREESARKLEAAGAEAEALKAQASKIAAVEKDAIEQSKNTWGARIKNIVGATVSAAGGAFFGGIGARAGQEAVDAVFNDSHKHGQ